MRRQHTIGEPMQAWELRLVLAIFFSTGLIFVASSMSI
jgi:hypothetical protein